MNKLRTLLEAHKIAEALTYFAGQPANAEACALLLSHARNWHTLGLLDEQRLACEAVLAHDNTNAEAWHLLGFYAQCQGDFAQAEKYYATALHHQTGFAFSQLALAQIRMLRTRFQDGRNLYEARFDAVTEKSGADWRSLPIPRWQGESLTGKSIYLWEEQGLGDIIMFAGLLPFILAQHPKRVALGVNTQLLPLLARSLPDVNVEPIEQLSNHALASMALQLFPKRQLFKDAALNLELLEAAYHYAMQHGVADYAAPLGDLLIHALPNFTPKGDAYLQPDPARKATLQAMLNALSKDKRLIGISWHTSNAREALRTIPLEAWLPLLQKPNCFFVSLQHHYSRETLNAFCAKHDCTIWQHPAQELTDNAEDLTALIASMDHVITIDNSNAHIAGALGVPTTLLLPKGHNFRWPELPEDGNLWYKSVTILRQQQIGAWDDVLTRAQDTLT